jgi:hypothetical protein
MKETIAEYSRVLIVLIAFAMMITFIFSGVWFNNIGKASAAMGNKVSVEKQDAAFDKLVERSVPTIYVTGKTVHVGELVNLFAIIPDHYNGEYAIKDADGNNLKQHIKISCNSPDFDKETNALIPSTAGVYKVNYEVRDSYGLSASKTINIVAN